jgi:hypothetical protein
VKSLPLVARVAVIAVVVLALVDPLRPGVRALKSPRPGRWAV